INLRPGMQRLDGGNALAYVRFRHDALGDISRTQRQQKFLTTLAGEMLQTSTIIKLPRLIPQLMDAVETNLGARDAIFLARAASNLDPNNIVTATLPGSFFNYKGVSYWKVDEAQTKVVLNEMFQGTKVATITGPDINVPVQKRDYKRVRSQGSIVKIVPVADDVGNNGSRDIVNTPQEQGTTENNQTTDQNNTGGNTKDTKTDQGLPPDATTDQVNPDAGQLNQYPGGQPQKPTSGQAKPPINSGTPAASVPGTNQNTTVGGTGKAGTTNPVTTPSVDIVTQG
ncbi:MAG TPA: LCP family protein, partial [Verrucomicrobiae bacterium]|nr:LCP family protein [Verrucomicrobiae bacterium]